MPGRGQSSALEAMYGFFRGADGPEVALSSEFAHYDSSHFHEAGYDAYVTGIPTIVIKYNSGYCFAKMTQHLSVFELEKYRNQLYSHKSPYDINLAGADTPHENVRSPTEHVTQ